jgi:hypothetical protein
MVILKERAFAETAKVFSVSLNFFDKSAKDFSTALSDATTFAFMTSPELRTIDQQIYIFFDFFFFVFFNHFFFVIAF